ncbi:hypothetical protein N7G274_004166 [Stereocaulon virgatum]|uniref:Uncharacterized protein n=1 Tax=Stereocaulon virgatum TaxID=373712 RepID=A0ABR4ACA8_9LECA
MVPILRTSRTTSNRAYAHFAFGGYQFTRGTANHCFRFLPFPTWRHLGAKYLASRFCKLQIKQQLTTCDDCPGVAFPSFQGHLNIADNMETQHEYYSPLTHKHVRPFIDLQTNLRSASSKSLHTLHLPTPTSFTYLPAS